MCKCTSWMRHRTRVYPSSATSLSKSATADLDAQARNPYSRRWLWIPGSRGACHRAALCADPLARPGMTGLNSQIHHHVVAFHGYRERLRHVGSLHHACAGLDVDRIGLGAKSLGVAIGLAGADIEFPAVPGAADDFAEPGIFDLAWIGRLREPDQRSFAQRRALMRA